MAGRRRPLQAAAAVRPAASLIYIIAYIYIYIYILIDGLPSIPDHSRSAPLLDMYTNIFYIQYSVLNATALAGEKGHGRRRRDSRVTGAVPALGPITAVAPRQRGGHEAITGGHGRSRAPSGAVTGGHENRHGSRADHGHRRGHGRSRGGHKGRHGRSRVPSRAVTGGHGAVTALEAPVGPGIPPSPQRAPFRAARRRDAAWSRRRAVTPFTAVPPPAVDIYII